MKPFDNYEISPCRRYQQINHPGQFFTEQCPDADAEFWTLYGHIPGKGVEAIGDFISREAAEQTFERITGIPFAGTREVMERVRVMHAGPRLLEALLDALPYVEDVISNPEQLACFKKGAVQAHVKAIRAAIAEAEGSAA
jgi:hypothetical protein